VYDADRGLVVREVATGRVLARLRQDAEGDDLYENGLELAFSRDSSRFAYLALEKRGKTLRIVRTRGGTVLRRLDARRMFGLSLEAWSPSGDRVAFASGNTGDLRVLDVASGDARRLDATTIELAWAPAGERIALGGGDGVRISDERQRFGEPIEAGEAVDLIRWSPNGTALALVLENVVSDYKRALAVLSLTPPGKPRILVPYSDRGVSALQWSPDATRIAYSG
jgi:Tol biopolymer transport system component